VGITSDRLGRRRAIAFGCIWGVIGGALMAGAVHVAMRKCLLLRLINVNDDCSLADNEPTVILGRILVGFAVGTITGVAPVFGAEIAKTHERAKITAVNQMSQFSRSCC
jgi:MFS family permease